MSVSQFSSLITPFDSTAPVPVQLMMGIMGEKSKVMTGNLAKIQGGADQFGQYDVARDSDKAVLYNKLNTLVDSVNSLGGGGADLTDPAVMMQISTMGSAISKDKQILNGLAQTKLMRSEIALADEARKNNKDYAPQNERALNRQVQSYLTSTGEQAKFTGKWSPYYDYNKDLQDAYGKMKANGVYRPKLDGTYGYFTEQGEEITPERVSSYLHDRINQDPRIASQLSIDVEDAYSNAPVQNIMNGYLPLAKEKITKYGARAEELNTDMQALANSTGFATDSIKQQQYQALTAERAQYLEASGALTKQIADPVTFAQDIEQNRLKYGMEIHTNDLTKSFVNQFAYSKVELKHLANPPKGSGIGTDGTGSPGVMGGGSGMPDVVTWEPTTEEDKKIETEEGLRSTIVGYENQINGIKTQLFNDIKQEYPNIKSVSQVDDFITQQQKFIETGQYDKVAPEYRSIHNQLVIAKMEVNNANSVLAGVDAKVAEATKADPNYPKYENARVQYSGQLKGATESYNSISSDKVSQTEMEEALALYHKFSHIKDMVNVNGLYSASDFLSDLQDPEKVGTLANNKVIKKLQPLYSASPDNPDVRNTLEWLRTQGEQTVTARKEVHNTGSSIGVGDLKQKLYDTEFSYVGQVPMRSFDYIGAEKEGGDKGSLAAMRGMIRKFGNETAENDSDILPQFIGNDIDGNFYIKYSNGDSKMKTLKVSPEQAQVNLPGIARDKYPAVTQALLTSGETISNDAGQNIATNALSVFAPVHDPATQKYLYDKPVYLRMYNTAKSSGTLGPQSQLAIKVQYVDPTLKVNTWIPLKDSRGNVPVFTSVEQAMAATQELFSKTASAGVTMMPNTTNPIQ